MLVEGAAELEQERPAQLVGRAQELGGFRNALKGAAGGSGSLLLLCGPPGAGKSALLSRFGEAALAFGDVTSLSFGAAHRAWRAFSERSDNAPLSERVIEYFESAAGARQQTLLCDDLQLARPSDLEVVDALVDLAQATRLVIVLSFVNAAREMPPPHLAEAIARWRAHGATWLALQPLSEADMTLLLRAWQLSSSVIVDRVTAGEFLRVSEGNPRYAREFLAEVRRGCSASEAVPFSAAAAASALRAGAEPQTVETLSVAAVFGERFDERWLSQVLGYAGDDVARAIQEGIDRSLLCGALDRQGFYVFNDLAVQKALYVSIAPHRRRKLHASVAQLLESGRADESFDELIAFHWESAGEFARATQWLMQSAAQLVTRGSHRAAAEFYERAACHSAETPQVALLQRAAQCYEDAGDVESAIPLRERAFAEPSAYRDPTQCAAACVALVDDYLWTGRRVDARNLVKSFNRTANVAVLGPMARSSLCLALRLCDEGMEADARAAFGATRLEHLPPSDGPRYDLVSAMLRAESVTIEETLASVASVANRAEQVDDARRSTSTLWHAANFVARLGHLQTALNLVERSERRAAQSDVPDETKLWTRMVQAYYRIVAGDLVEAKKLLASLAVVREAGDLWDVSAASLNVLVGMRTGDAVLVDAFLDLALLRRTIESRRAGPCAALLMSFPEGMAARGLTSELRQTLRHCADYGLSDPFFSMELAIARFGPLECVAAARERIRRRAKNVTTGAIARAASQLFDAWVAKRRGNGPVATRAALAAATAYGKLGWRLEEAQGLELAGDFAAARDLYERCGAVCDAGRLRRKPRRSARGAPLTLREREIAEFVCFGQSDAKIARQLGLSTRTVQNHVSAILGKLGIRARWQLGDALERVSNYS
jgi:DNA-binding CsgD family transcriptional regulator/tetratricopeptide (TPR) repeat protein